MSERVVKYYEWDEELANAITHGVGAGLSIAALVIMLVYSASYGDAWKVLSSAIYGGTMILLYLSSMFYHIFQTPNVKWVFRIFDHSAIFMLIAGTYTPITLITLHGGWGWTLFSLIWAFAIAGIVHTAFFIDKFRRLSVIIYLAMGWLGIIAIKPIIALMPHGGLIWLAVGGLAYTGGTVFYAWNSLRYNHAIWHLFVLAGSACHFVAIYKYVL